MNIGVGEATIHDMRRTFVTEGLEKGIDPGTIAKMAGIKTLQVMVDTYTRPSLDHDRRALDKMQIDTNIEEPETKKKKGASD